VHFHRAKSGCLVFPPLGGKGSFLRKELSEALRNTERFWGDWQSAAFPPTGIYRHFFHLRFLTRSFAALRMTVRAGRHSRNADYILIAAKRRYHNPRAGGPSNLRTLGPERPINLKHPHAPSVSKGDTTTLSGPKAVVAPFYITRRRRRLQPAPSGAPLY